MDYLFTVRRIRQSATQGMATVYLNGEELISFGDTIEIIKDGEKYYGAKIGDWASKKPDGDFVYGVLFHPCEEAYGYSNRVKKILKGDSSVEH